MTVDGDGATASTCSTDHLIDADCTERVSRPISDPRALPEPAAIMTPMALRVMTWNLWWRFGPFELRRPAIVEVIRAADPDVVCLQEVWSDGSADEADRIAAATGMTAVRTTPMLYNGQSFGNAVLSRWPAELIADEPLPRADGTPGHRRVVAAAVDTPWGRWPFTSTHLDHRFDASADRHRQVLHLMERAVGWRGDPERDLPLVLGADLNAVADSDEVRTLTGRRPGVAGIVFSDAWEQVGSGAGHTWRRANPYSEDSAWPDRRLDYVLVSWPRPKPTGNPVRAWIVGDGPIAVDGEEVWPSDHAAVVAELVTPA